MVYCSFESQLLSVLCVIINCQLSEHWCTLLSRGLFNCLVFSPSLALSIHFCSMWSFVIACFVIMTWEFIFILKNTFAFLCPPSEIAAQSESSEIRQDWKPPFLSNEEFTQLMLEVRNLAFCTAVLSVRCYFTLVVFFMDEWMNKLCFCMTKVKINSNHLNKLN